MTADKPRPVVTRVGVLGHASGGPSAPPRALQVVGTVRNSPTLPTARVAKGPVAKGPASLQQCPPDACVAKSEEVERRGLSSLFVALAEVVRAESSVLQSLEGYQAEQLVFLFADRAPSTLRRHLSGWRRWILFCSASGISAGLPECRHIVDYLDALAEGASSNRGSCRCRYLWYVNWSGRR